MSLASELRCALDPGELMRRAGMEPDTYQDDYLLSDAPRILLLQSRQSGKSETTAAKCLHRAMYTERSLVVAIGAAQRQSDEVMAKAHALYNASPAVDLIGRPAERRMRFANGSRFVSLPASEATVRSFSGVKLLVLDEAARIPDPLYASVHPFLAVSHGDLVLLSSAFGKRGFFWEAWNTGLPKGWEEVYLAHHVPRIEVDDGAPRFARALTPADRGHGWQLFNERIAQLGPARSRWKRYLVTVDDVPRISDAYLQDVLESVGVWWLEQEFFARFHDAAGALFSYDLIVQALSHGPDAFDFRPQDLDPHVAGAVVDRVKPMFGGVPR
jgi:Terminase large subunit, T4likevirus-type, N-terminal